MQAGDPVALPDRESGYPEPVDREPVGQHVRRRHLEQCDRPPQRLDVGDVHAEPVALLACETTTTDQAIARRTTWA